MITPISNLQDYRCGAANVRKNSVTWIQSFFSVLQSFLLVIKNLFSNYVFENKWACRCVEERLSYVHYFASISKGANTLRKYYIELIFSIWTSHFILFLIRLVNQ